MALIAYHASHEQFAPSKLLDLVIKAERAGFEAIHCSDHFHPWNRNQGQSGYTFSWLGAAMQATQLPFSAVCAPGQRYHPAIVAQAIATLAELFPGRFDIELGSGEAINESITGEHWPKKEERNQRLLESANIIRKLLEGDEVNFEGKVKVKNARLYSLPSSKPLLFCAAISQQTAAWAGHWADGLITTAGEMDGTGKKIEAFRSKAGNDKPCHIQLSFSFASTKEEAAQGAFEQWYTNILPLDKLANLETVTDFEKEASGITIQDVADKIPLFTSMTELMYWVDTFSKLNPARIVLHNVHPDQEYFIQCFARERH